MDELPYDDADYAEASGAPPAPAAAGLDRFYVPPLVLVGALGNMLALFVFLRGTLRSLCSSQYLAALAVSDTLFLLLLLLPWLNGNQLLGLFHWDGVCQAVVYLSYVACSCNAWLVTTFTVERFVAVEYPLRGRRCEWNARHSRWVVLATVLAAFAANTPLLFLAMPSQHDCNIDMTNLSIGAVFNMADTILNFTVPMIIIIVLNARIMFGVYRLPESAPAPQEAVHFGRRRVLLRRRRASCAQRRVTRMLLIVSSSYVFLNLPNYLMRLFAYAYETSEILNTPAWSLAQQLSQMIFNLNFAINFLLYCISGTNFRHALYQAVPFLRRRREQSALCQRISNPPTRTSVNYSRRGRCGDSEYIRRWVFDNSQPQRPESGLELRDLPPRAATPTPPPPPSPPPAPPPHWMPPPL